MVTKYVPVEVRVSDAFFSDEELIAELVARGYEVMDEKSEVIVERLKQVHEWLYLGRTERAVALICALCEDVTGRLLPDGNGAVGPAALGRIIGYPLGGTSVFSDNPPQVAVNTAHVAMNSVVVGEGVNA